ncbi:MULTISPECIES: urease accessory protein UreF [Priestia]|uniref:Urease accessory protein UreF n=2 Tax=Priestia megaterium TaxID=1404 RepID=A0AAX6BLD2_PRIMG|nr:MULTISPECIES: urease accessory protein UreF [Priestia]MCL9635280.1 urease accessory protein UreF [Bacillus zanthoxyli]NHH93216.1 Urease accessory protein UreF [Bacillus sp. MB95]AKP78034.1 Urease accessory protein UreF [Priestia megaterium Q3]MBY0005508.1 urease accessory protein UreF [Priestia aryabhattai]MBY0047811.1 urease accessory protein UreF [Priestia aryabhattai]
MTNSLLSLIQLCDSNFPSGAFSHSFGFETYIQRNQIYDTETFQEALRTYLDVQLTYTDGLACRLAYEYAVRDQFNEIMRIDHELYALALSKETREGTRRVGQRMLKLCLELFQGSYLEKYMSEVKAKKAYGHPAVVFALASLQLNITKEEAILSHLYASISSLIQNAVRGIPIGQTDGQKTLVLFQPLLQQALQHILQADQEEFGAVTPGLEIAQMQHEQLHVRLFMS